MYNLLNIKKIAEIKEISVRAMAIHLGMTDGALHKAVKNNSMSLDKLDKLCDLLGVSISELVGDNRGSTVPGNIGFEKTPDAFIESYRNMAIEVGQLREKLKQSEEKSKRLKSNPKMYELSSSTLPVVAESESELEKYRPK